MSKWTKTTDHQQVRVTGDVTLTIERMDKSYWKWTVQHGGRYITDDETGEYAHTEAEAKILAELNAL